MPDRTPDASGTEKIFKLATNENPLGPSPAAVEAIRRCAPALGEYPPGGDEKLRHALAAAHDNKLSPDHFFTACGGYEALDIMARAYLRPGDEGIICRPTFGVYERTARLQEAEVIDVPLDPERFTHRIDALLAAVTPRTRLIYLCNPNNPTGAVLPADDMAALLTNLPRDVLVIADEVYHHYVRHPAFPDSIAHVSDGRNVVILHSFSKAYGLAGLRLAYGIARPDVTARLARYRRHFHLSTLHIEGGIAALRDREHIRKSAALAWRGKRWLQEQFARLGLRTWPSQTNFMLFRSPIPADDLAARLLASGVAVRSGTYFGLPDCVRVSVGTPEANEAFIRALETTL